MNVRSIMRGGVQFCGLEDDLVVAGTKMEEGNCGFLPVLGDGGHVVGVLTDRDICLALARLNRKPSEVKAREVMSRDVCCCLEDTDVRDALRMMRDRVVRRLPVVDRHQHLLGVLSFDDIAVAARAFQTEGFSGLYYPDVALTLQTICAREIAAKI